MKNLKIIFKILILTILFFPVSAFFSQDLKHKKYDSILLNKPKEMVNNNIPNEKIILWNLEMLEKMKKENYPRGIIWAHINIAQQYWNLGKGEESIKNLTIAKNLSDKYKVDFFTQAKIYQEYSQAYYIMAMYNIGLKYNSKAAYYGNKIEDPDRKNKFLSYVYTTRANFLYSTKNLDSALVYLHKSSLTYKSPNTFSAIANFHLTYSHNLDSAKIYLDKTLFLIKKDSTSYPKYDRSVFYYTYGVFLMSQKEYGKAIPYLEKSLFLTGKDDYIHLNNVYNQLSLSYKHVNNKQKEKYFHEMNKTLSDSLKESRYKSMEITLDNVEKSSEIEKKKLKDNLWRKILLIITISLIVIGYFYYQNRRKKIQIQKREQLIVQKEGETENLKQKLSASINDSFEELVEMAKENNPEFLPRFKEVYPEFCNKLVHLDPKITSDSLKFCALLRLNFSTKEISDYTFVTIRAVQIRKGRLRKKLDIPSNIDLNVWMVNL